MLNEDHDKTRRVTFVTHKRFAVPLRTKVSREGEGEGRHGFCKPLPGYYFLKKVFVVENDM